MTQGTAALASDWSENSAFWGSVCQKILPGIFLMAAADNVKAMKDWKAIVAAAGNWTVEIYNSL